MRSIETRTVPVIALTGHLGAGKTTLLNHLLRAPGARVGVVVNDFGAVNVDAGLVTGQIDEPFSIAGGCICCLDDVEQLDEAIATLSRPSLALDAIIVEASGVAEPGALAALIRRSSIARARPGGVIDVIDAVEHFATVDTAAHAPARHAAASLVAVTKLDALPPAEREPRLARIARRVHERGDAIVVRADHGRIDPELVFDASRSRTAPDELPIADLLLDEAHEHHVHASAVSATSEGPVDPSALVALLEAPPAGAYRVKGAVAVATTGRERRFVVHVVGHAIHVRSARHVEGTASSLVAIGATLDVVEAQRRLDDVVRGPSLPDPRGLARLDRLRRLSA